MDAYSANRQTLISRRVVTDSGCWEWQGAKGRRGYGLMWCRIEHRLRPAHRIAYEAWAGPIPKEHEVCHHCDNPPCFNPDHLFSGTRLDNERDKVAKGRQASGDRNGSRLHPERLARGESIPWHRLTDDEVRAMRAEHAAGATTVAIGERHGVSQAPAWNVVNGKTWKHVE